MADVDGAALAPAEHQADFHSHAHHVGAWNDFVMADVGDADEQHPFAEKHQWYEVVMADDVVAAEEQHPLAQNHQSVEVADATHVADVAEAVVEEHTAQ